jgi:hypothetical protein
VLSWILKSLPAIHQTQANKEKRKNMKTINMELDDGMLAEIEKQAADIHLFADEFCSLIVLRSLVELREQQELYHK